MMTEQVRKCLRQQSKYFYATSFDVLLKRNLNRKLNLRFFVSFIAWKRIYVTEELLVSLQSCNVESLAFIAQQRIYVTYLCTCVRASCTNTFSKWCKMTTGMKRSAQVKVKVTLQPTISRRPSGTRDQFFYLLEIFF
jgi:hypothetical protein